MSELRLNARVHAWVRRLALGGTKNDSYKVIKLSKAIGAWENDKCVKDIGTVYCDLSWYSEFREHEYLILI